MNDISKIRMAKNELNRSLNMDILRKNEQFSKEINELILKTPTGDLRNTYTNLNILFESMKGDYESLIKLHQI